MIRKRAMILILAVLLLISGCEKALPELLPEQKAAADTLGIPAERLRELLAKPLYEFSETDVDIYLPYLQYTVPGLQERIKHLARKNLGQPYEIYLLGEHPAEIYDPQPLYILDKSDCVVFCEHMIAMALADDWQSFFAILQRIRYKDGQISYAARNHYGEYDWLSSNEWLVDNITADLAPEYQEFDTAHVNKTRFFGKRGVPYAMPEDSLVWNYVPIEVMPGILSQLRTGDIVNVVRGYKHNRWIGHFGFVMVDGDSVYFLHSTPPEVIQQPFLEVLDKLQASNMEKKKANLIAEEKNKEIKAFNESHEEQLPYEPLETLTLGYRFLRIKDDPLKHIMKPGQELRLQVVPVTPLALKTTRADSVLRMIK